MDELRHRKRWDNIWIGILVGLAVPLAAFGILLTIFDSLDALGLMENRTVSPTFRVRTLSLVGICLNIIPLHIFQRRYMYNAMRGLVFPTLFYAILWFVKYYDILL